MYLNASDDDFYVREIENQRVRYKRLNSILERNLERAREEIDREKINFTFFPSDFANTVCKFIGTLLDGL